MASLLVPGCNPGMNVSCATRAFPRTHVGRGGSPPRRRGRSPCDEAYFAGLKGSDVAWMSPFVSIRASALAPAGSSVAWMSP